MNAENMNLLRRAKPGDQLFPSEEGESFGTVLDADTEDLRVYIEGFGPTALPPTAVKAVHDAKVIVDIDQLPRELREGVAHAHDRETEY